ncbi:MAG: MoxR family ATPase [Rhodanobacteraceae bacterium]|nr:MoxR family ATPase [Xanthomonadales bacterium]MCP5474590.1 MoxR family ATPase [Rhodanobacteraceae bacterium]
MADAAATLARELMAPLHAAEAQINQVLLGKAAEVRLTLVCLLAGGHLLLEDLPGVGKTTLAQALAATFDLSFGRVQFTSDLLPADLIGVSVFDPQTRRFDFHPGPIFTQMLLADEINRGTPKLQSALLEAMAEQQVTVDGASHRLPEPFIVVATQNPLEQSGTFPLPESQLDRFMFSLNVGYPDERAEKALLAARERRFLLTELKPLLSAERLLQLREAALTLHTSPAAIDYAYALIAASRSEPRVRIGLSPRAGIALLRAARSHALLASRTHVLPEDLQAVFVAVARHRLVLNPDASGDGASIARHLLAQVAIP